MPWPDHRVRSTVLRWTSLGLIATGLLALGMAGGWRLAGATETETEIGRVAFSIHPSLGGGAEAVIPVADWGFRADAFDAPFEIGAELRSLDRDAALRAAEGDASLLEALERDLRDGARSAALRGLAWGAGASISLCVVATLLWRRLRPRWALVASGIAVTAIAGGASVLAAQATFDARAFDSPTYFANGEELRRILDVAEDERVRSQYGSTFASILRSVTSVLTDETTQAPGRDLYVASDLHANPLVVAPLGRSIGAAPVLFAGDVGQRGGEAEAALLAPRVAALGERVVAVSGNHDSRSLMRRLAAEGVATLGDDDATAERDRDEESSLLDVDDLTIAGFPDPLEWRGEGDPASRPVTFEDLPDPEAAFERALADFVRWFDALPRRPAVVMVHQNALAQGLADRLYERGYSDDLTIVTGHDHRQHVDRYGSILVVDGGSVGAGGAFEAGRRAIGFAELHFAPADPALRSVDLIAIEPFSGQAQASRVVIDALCPETDRCSVEPAGLEASPPTER